MDPSIAVALVLVGAAGLALELGFSSAIAEILAGIVLAWFYSDIASLDWLNFLGNLGLLGLMFMAGFEVDIPRLQKTWRASTGVGVISLALPMTGVFLVCRYVLEFSFAPAALMAIGLSTTSLALVYHALRERGDLDADFGQTVLGAATIVDVLSMICLAGLLGDIGWSTGIFLLVLIPTMFGLPRIGAWIFRRYKGSVVEFEMRFLMVLLISMGFMAEHIGGIHPAVIAFLLGLIMAEVVEEHEEVEEKLKGVVFSLFAPVFFLQAGARIDLSLVDMDVLGIFAVLATVAVGLKFIGTALATKWLIGRSAGFVGLLFNYRLSFGTATATVGLKAGIITAEQFTVILLVVVCGALLPALLLRQKPNELDRPDRII